MAKGKIVPLPYEEARQAFFKKKFKSAERRLSRVVDHGLPPDKCAELADEVNFYRDALTGAMQWIPVNKRLPKDCGEYLVRANSERFPGVKYTGICLYCNDNKTWYGDHSRVEGITHWMPLPEPPEVDVLDTKTEAEMGIETPLRPVRTGRNHGKSV